MHSTKNKVIKHDHSHTNSHNVSNIICDKKTVTQSLIIVFLSHEAQV